MDEQFEQLLMAVREAQIAGDLPTEPTLAQRADWAYGQTVLENPDVTREHAEMAARNCGK